MDRVICPHRSAPALRLSCSSPRHPHLAFPHCHINASPVHLSVPEAAQEFPEVQEQEQGEGQSWDRELERVRERAKSPAVTACLPDRKDQRNSSLFLKASPVQQEPYGPRFPAAGTQLVWPPAWLSWAPVSMKWRADLARTALPFWQPANTGDCLWLQSALQARAPDASCGEFLKKIQEVWTI